MSPNNYDDNSRDVQNNLESPSPAIAVSVAPTLSSSHLKAVEDSNANGSEEKSDRSRNLTISSAFQESPKSVQETKPFSVAIDDVRYYGGLITYTHHLHPARICRVLNGCIRSDGTLLLPSWMQRHDDIITFHCGHLKVDFSLPDTEPPSLLQGLDLVGLKVPRPSMPDFIVDFLPNAVVFDLIYGLHNVNKVCHSRTGVGCEDFPGLANALRTTVILPRRLSFFDEKKSWAREFVNLMKPPQIGRQPKVIYDSQLDRNVSHTKCFRSVFFTRGPFNKNYIMANHLRKIHFLDLQGIEKEARDVMTTPNDSQRMNGPHCSLNVTLSNRRLSDGALNRLVGRYIVNVSALKQAIMKQAAHIPGLNLSVDTLTLEGRSLRWQINAMQKTDILVAGHGPLLTNMIFLRENSTIIELQPFTYYPQTYEKLALRLAHVQYDRYIAHPDMEAFEACMHYLYPPSNPMHSRAMEILSKFDHAVQKYKQSDSTHSFVLHGIREKHLQNVRRCALMQRLDSDAEKLAIAIVRQARLRCGLSLPKY